MPRTPPEPSIPRSRDLETAARSAPQSRRRASDPVRRYCLRDDADRIGEVDNPRARRGAGDEPRVLDGGRDVAHRHGEAGRSDGLLADDAKGDRRGLIARAGGNAAGPDAQEDEVRVRHTPVSVAISTYARCVRSR